MADDDLDDQQLTREAFAANEVAVPVHFVGDGDQVLDYIAGRSNSGLPSLILLDLNMPKRNGYETLDALKRDARLRHIPVIILTSSQAVGEIRSSYSHGASSFITKPVTFAAMVEVIGNLGRYWLDTVRLPA